MIKEIQKVLKAAKKANKQAVVITVNDDGTIFISSNTDQESEIVIAAAQCLQEQEMAKNN